MSRNIERVVWMTIGAAVGTGVALLYAPRTGRDARRLLRRKARGAREMIVEAGDSMREMVDNVTYAGRDAYDTVIDAGREAYKRGASAAAGVTGRFERGRRSAR